MEINSKEFRNKELTITYDPCICKQSGICANELSNVFRSSVIPWVDIEGAPTHAIIKQIKKCPSGALNFYKHKKEVV